MSGIATNDMSRGIVCDSNSWFFWDHITEHGRDIMDHLLTALKETEKPFLLELIFSDASYRGDLLCDLRMSQVWHYYSNRGFCFPSCTFIKKPWTIFQCSKGLAKAKPVFTLDMNWTSLIFAKTKGWLFSPECGPGEVMKPVIFVLGQTEKSESPDQTD